MICLVITFVLRSSLHLQVHLDTSANRQKPKVDQKKMSFEEEALSCTELPSTSEDVALTKAVVRTLPQSRSRFQEKRVLASPSLDALDRCNTGFGISAYYTVQQKAWLSFSSPKVVYGFSATFAREKEVQDPCSILWSSQCCTL